MFQIIKSIVDEKIVNSPEHIPSSVVSEGLLYVAYCDYQLGNYANALQNCQKVVNNWPDYSYTHYVQLLTASSYKKLVKSGTVTVSEANPQIEQALIAVLEKRNVDNKSIVRAMRGLSNLNLE